MSQNYKETLNLPRTDFPMKANLTAREPKLLGMWKPDAALGADPKIEKGPTIICFAQPPSPTATFTWALRSTKS
jgi:isoleucyl-tRNA synthetase